MARYLGPKLKLSRREGTDLFTRQPKSGHNKPVVAVIFTLIKQGVGTTKIPKLKGRHFVGYLPVYCSVKTAFIPLQHLQNNGRSM